MENNALLNAITDALRDMAEHPDNNVPDIWNEYMDAWETGLQMNHRMEIERIK